MRKEQPCPTLSGPSSDAWDVAITTAPKLAKLEAETVRFVRAFCDSDLPEAIKDAALSNTSTLRTQTSFRTPDGHARAMSSWACVLAYTGFLYSAVNQSIQFRASNRSATWFWSNGSAWATFTQKRGGRRIDAELTVLHGEITLKTLTLTGAGSTEFAGRKITAGKSAKFRILTGPTPSGAKASA